MFEPLYDISVQSQVNFVGYATEHARYDFAIIYTDHFFGKPLVICMQRGKSALMCHDDVTNLDHLKSLFQIETDLDAFELSQLLQQWIPPVSTREQYA